MFALVVAEENKLGGKNPDEVQPLVEEFMDILPKEIPPVLPLMRYIQNCSDFILGSSILNKAVNRMNLKEYEELQQQVLELLEKGLIRENMSLCDVPAYWFQSMVGVFCMCIDY